MQDLHIRYCAFLVSLAFALIIISSPVSAVGVAPAISEITFEPNMEKTVTLKIINSEKSDVSITMSVDGSLSDYITLELSEFEISKDEPYKRVNYRINLPADIGEPGPHETRILISTKKKITDSKGTEVSAKVVVYSILRIFVAYPGEYAKVRLIAPNFEVGKESFFGVEINNLGTEDILANSLIEILSPLNAKIASLKGDEASVKTKNTELVSIGWTPKNPGDMLAKANVIYGNNKFTEDEKKFTAGEPSIEIYDISSDDFILGGISRFEIIVNNKWNNEISDAYAHFLIVDENENLYSQYTSEHVTIPSGAMYIIPAYLETNKLSVGKYILKINLHYLGKEEEKIFPIDVGKDSVKISMTGKMVSDDKPSDESENEFIFELFYALIILIVVSNVIVYKKLSGKKKQNYIE